VFEIDIFLADMLFVVKKVFVKFLIPVVLFGLPFVVPVYAVGFDVSTFATIFSMIFVILVGFFIAAATANYLNLQSHLAEETAYLIALFSLGVSVQPSMKKKLGDVIDAYLIAAVDYPLLEYANKTRKELHDVIDVVDSIEVKVSDPKGMVALDHLYEAKISLIKTLHSVAFSAPRVVHRIHWVILTALASALVFLLFTLRTGEVLAGIVIGVLTISLYLVLILLHEVDNNDFLEDSLAYSDVQKVFEAIGKLKYYPETAFRRYGNDQLQLDKDYRVGIYKDYPKSMEKRIKIVKV